MANRPVATADTLQALPVFASLPRSSLDLLVNAGKILQLTPPHRLSELVRPTLGASEGYCFVLAGEIAIVADEPDRETPEFVGRFMTGDLFSDAYLDRALGTGDIALDCMAATSATVLAVPSETLTLLMGRHPGWAAHLAQSIGASRRRFLAQQEPTRRLVQDFFLRHGYGAARRIRVSEMTRCFDCNKCEVACAKRHGQPRMGRTHARLGRLTFQRFCVQCTDQACLGACAFGAISTDAAGEIRISDACNGCGACARKCRYGAISIVDLPYTSADFAAAVPVCGDNGATSLPGLFAAGDVLGPRSIKAAIQEAKRVVDALGPRRAHPYAAAQVLDVVIVGAGTAGLAAAERCSERRLTFVVLEKNPALSSKASRLTSAMTIQPAMEVQRIGQTADGLLAVAVAEGSFFAHNVLVCTGKPAPGSDSLLRRAGAAMIEPGTEQMAAHALGRGTHAVASKCDNCAGYPDRACIRACPTGSLIELPPQELFFEPAADRSGDRSFSGVAFVEGVAEHRARLERHPRLRFLSALTIVLALLGIGVECFLRRTLPEHSLLGMARARLGDLDPIWYSSGKGFGHWLGYIGTALMLSTLLYPLRTRCGLFKSWGAQSRWLTVHLWVGFIGATLVTYHAAFKLDRWVALSCYAMWTVVLSGAIGRYLYGMIHSGIGLLDLEREALRRSVVLQTVRQNLSPQALRLLRVEGEKAGPLYAELFVMLWHELHDFAVLAWLRLVGLSGIPDRQTRRQTLQYLSDIAGHRRARRYLESAKRLLRYWNWVHIVLTIAMFIIAGVHVTYGFMYKAV